MQLLPWRLRNLISDHFPLFYHLAANLGRPVNDRAHWDARLMETWDSATRKWPTKNELIASLTTRSSAILDVGCGTGDLLRFLQKLGYEDLHGLEISNYAIERLRHCGITMHRGLLPNIPLPAASFDFVIASQVLEHIVRRRRFLSEISRVLKPGGQVFIFVPDDCLGPISEPEHVTKFNGHSLDKLVSRFFSLRSVRSIRDVNHPMPVLFAQAEKVST